jgi:single-strand DNA-binding protein
MKVYIEGSLSTRSWEAEDGSTRYKTEVRVEDMILLDSKGKQGAGDTETTTSDEETKEVETPEANDEQASDEDPLEDSDLPF